MKKSRFTERQIVAILKETDTGMKVADVCRKHGISQPTYYNWKSKYGRLSVSDLKRTRELEAELSKLKPLTRVGFRPYKLSNQPTCLNIRNPLLKSCAD